MTGIGINIREVQDDNGGVKLKVLGLILDGPAHAAGVRQVVEKPKLQMQCANVHLVLCLSFVLQLFVFLLIDMYCHGALLVLQFFI